MGLGFWIGTATVLTISECGLVLATIVGGTLLRESQESAAKTALFGIIRRHGAINAARHLASLLFHRKFRILLRRYGKDWKNFAIPAAAILGASCFMIFISFTVLFFLPGVRSSHGTRTTSALIWSDIAGLTTVGGWLWLSGLIYAARSGVAGRGALPRIGISEIAEGARVRLALRIYWSECRDYILLAVVLFSWVFLLAIEAGAPDATQLGLGNNAPAHGGVFAGWIAILIIPAILPVIVERLFGRMWIFDRIEALICKILESRTSESGSNEFDYLLVDPLGRKRADLGRLALQLSAAARLLDSRQAHGTAPHPVSTLLRATSHRISVFLRNQQSWSESVPTNITEILRHTAATLAVPGNNVEFQALQAQLQAFDADGNPTVEAKDRPPSRMAVAMNRAAAGFKGFVAVVVGMATVAAVVIVCVLYAQHRISIIDFQHYLP